MTQISSGNHWTNLMPQARFPMSYESGLGGDNLRVSDTFSKDYNKDL